MKYYRIDEYASEFGLTLEALAHRFGAAGRQNAKHWQTTGKMICVSNSEHTLVKPERVLSKYKISKEKSLQE